MVLYYKYKKEMATEMCPAKKTQPSLESCANCGSHFRITVIPIYCYISQ